MKNTLLICADRYASEIIIYKNGEMSLDDWAGYEKLWLAGRPVCLFSAIVCCVGIPSMHDSNWVAVVVRMLWRHEMLDDINSNDARGGWQFCYWFALLCFLLLLCRGCPRPFSFSIIARWTTFVRVRVCVSVGLSTMLCVRACVCCPVKSRNYNFQVAFLVHFSIGYHDNLKEAEFVKTGVQLILTYNMHSIFDYYYFFFKMIVFVWFWVMDFFFNFIDCCSN